MPGVRDHDPVVLEQFNGWWKRGDAESAPIDHFIQADNIQYINSGFETRDGIDLYLPVGLFNSTIGPIRRLYSYLSPKGQGLLFLTDGGNI